MPWGRGAAGREPVQTDGAGPAGPVSIPRVDPPCRSAVSIHRRVGAPVPRLRPERSAHPPCVRQAGRQSALVEEPAFDDAGAVLGRHIDVRRSEKKHTLGDSVDAAVQPEDKARGEVH